MMNFFRNIERLAARLFAVLLLCSTVTYSAEREGAREKLEQAREYLRISEATEERIAAELQALLASGDASPEVLEDYEMYLERVQEMVQENRRIVQEMEAAYAGFVQRQGHLNASTPSDADVVPYAKHGYEDIDELGTLDREFDESLAAFDEMLLKELDEIRIRSFDKMKDLAEEAAAAARRLRERGAAVQTTSPEGSPKGEQESTEQGVDSGQGESAEQMGGQEQERGLEQMEGLEQQKGLDQAEGTMDTEGKEHASREQTSEGGKSGSEEKGEEGVQERDADTQENGRVGSEQEPTESQSYGGDEQQMGSKGAAGKGYSSTEVQRSRSYDDDDIVARQIREAAEKETDPELKEKLWREYEEYKRGTSR
jgi:hypothetical protein